VKGFINPILDAGKAVFGAVGGFFSGGPPQPAQASARVLNNAPANQPASGVSVGGANGPLSNALGQQAAAKLNGELVVRFEDAPPGLRVDPGRSNQPALSINPDVGYRSQLAF
jgi:hypothetical protein